jgi:prophage antirepressor-like protein
MSEVMPLVFQGQPIRMQVDEAGQTWWVAADVCAALRIHDVSKAVARLRSKEKRSESRNLLIINESGLYRLIMRSNKSEAERFQDWVYDDVLPAIRKTGRYEVPSTVERFPELKAIMQLVQEIADTRVKAEAAQALATEAKANADLALHAQQWLTIREYVYVHALHRQCPEQYWGALGRYLSSYCLEHNIPVRAQGVGDRRYATEHAYHVEVLHRLLPQWMARQTGQSSLRMLAREQLPDGEETS